MKRRITAMAAAVGTVAAGVVLAGAGAAQAKPCDYEGVGSDCVWRANVVTCNAVLHTLQDFYGGNPMRALKEGNQALYNHWGACNTAGITKKP
ncbi:hypothetical protein [Kitasatospora sp. NPDC059827]|uniref:hypothetical protein n=1 Tax=Kitasatospora sp. NPDC059827 TaxID=3346964 RepID=UPI003652AB67